MDRMKKFLICLLTFIAFYVFVSVITNIAVNNKYKEIECIGNDTGMYKVEVKTAKSTSMSGYIEGTIKLDEEAIEGQKYFKVDIYNKNNTFLGRKYVELDDVNPGEINNFKVGFNYDNATSYKLGVTNDLTDDFAEIQEDLIGRGRIAIQVVGILMILYYIW